MTTRAQIIVRGIVQGVGFRPFVYSRANRRSLTGRVRNSATGVLIDLEGNEADIEQFLSELQSSPPPLSSIESIERRDGLAPVDYSDFRILESESTGKKFVPVSSDVGTCDDCLDELFDPGNRRFRYPFINCTNCGPRFTIIESVPYDRCNTTMRSFTMCSECLSEYEDPANRRFHAEPIACEVCGPRLRLLDYAGRDVAGDPLSLTRDFLALGKIVAIKGIGGFHLACDALSEQSVSTLRKRKFREDKPFAIMARSVDVVRKYCPVSVEEEALLRSPSRPIVLLPRLQSCAVPTVVAPGVSTVGFMLPYAPLHHLLFEDSQRPLVMTSGNISDEPICFQDDEAGVRLGSIADFFLVHDRGIHLRTDDSVVRVQDRREMVLRRSRGFAPAPVATNFEFQQNILGCGAELKNTFCLARGRSAFISHHIGDLENLETLRSFSDGIDHFKRLFDLVPEVVAYDLHPEYLSTKYALAVENVDKIAVQHHHAHIASCMVDNSIEGEVIGVAFDGLGFGLDGKMWGGEFFVADLLDAERLAHLAYVPLAGGAKAIRQPWRMAAVYLERVFGDGFLELEIPFSRELDRTRWSTLRSMMKSGINCPETSSMGRLFDALAGLLNVRQIINYEGQAAIELETLADGKYAKGYVFELSGGEIQADNVVRAAVEDLLGGVAPTFVSAKFHAGVARLVCDVAQQIRAQRKQNRVVLSGGVFQNMLLLSTATRLLREQGFEVFTHHRVPTNDGGISLGQVAIANARLCAGRTN